MESFFEKNISIIKNKYPNLFPIIASISTDDIDVIESKTGDKIPAVEVKNNKIPIHSKFDPGKEASRFIDEIDPLNFDLFVVFGFGFAYHIEELLKKIAGDATLLVIEKNPGMIKAAISSRNIAGLLRDDRLKITVDPDEETLAELLKGKSSRRVSFLTHRASFQTDPEYYNHVIRLAKSYFSAKEVNIATLAKFEKTWPLNIARNIREFISMPGVNIFYNQFANMPTIIAGAGPSLTRSFDFIKNNQKRAVIICVDTSYLILRKNGIIPHFCVTVDPQLINARYFEGDVRSNTVFIADPSVHPSAYHFIKGNIAVAGMAFNMMKWIEEIMGEKGELAYGGSVMTNAYDFAKRIGASPVVLVGQDLAFTWGLAHARGSYLDEEVHNKATRFYNAEMQNRYQLNALPKIKVSSISSGETFTNQKLLIFLKWFEKRNDHNLINASYDGALINGIRHLSFNDINFPCMERDIFDLINSIYRKNLLESDRINTYRESLLKKISDSMNELNLILSNIKRALALSQDLIDIIKNKKKGAMMDNILQRLSEADRFIESKNTVKDMIGITIQRVIHTINEGYEIDENDEGLTNDELIAKKSYYLYKGIFEGAEFNKRILNKMTAVLKD